MTIGLGFLAIIGLVLANGFFVATEFAIVAVRRSRIDELAREGRGAAEAARQVIGHLDAYIAACQLGITISSLALGWIGEPALARGIEPLLAPLVGRMAPAAAHAVAVSVAFAVITALHIIAGELAPKGLALQRPEATVLWIARPIQLFYTVFRWPITALNALGNGLLRLVGLEPATGQEMVHSVEELRLLVTASQRAGVVEASEARIASRAFQLADLTADALMTPRTEIEALAVDTPFDALVARAAASRHSQLLVYDGSLDNILGAVHLRDVFRAVAQGTRPDLRPLLRPVLTVPETKRADVLLEETRRAPTQVAVVVDEYGGTAGIITLEDLVEGLVGRIEEPSAGVAGPPRAEPDGSLVLDGLTRLHELEELTGIAIDEADRATADTLSGLFMARLDRIPQVGDEIVLGDRIMRVERLRGRRVAAVRVAAAAQPRTTS
ncbi:MAG: hemolysin family protein [Candidatus Rokuibacteriota bacterium]